MLILSGIVFAQTDKPESLTARQYYEELKAASGVPSLMTMVCFRESSSDIFDVIGFTSEFEATAKAKGISLTPKDRKMFSARDGLFVQTYKKGVMTGEDLMTHDKSSPQEWYSGFQSKDHKFHLIVTLSPSGRYRRAVYVDTKALPTSEGYGKCEAIR